MLRAALCCLVATSALAVQVPLGSARHWQPAEHLADWSLDRLPNPNATDHLVFETVHSLLQHWPNTRMRNGHTIVPGKIPKGTLLYHGTSRNQLPPGPEWVATDPEHSYLFCRDVIDKGCWHLTLATTRPLKVVYFDGSSAVKIPYGSMDTQDLIAWGVSGPDVVSDEQRRITDLCKWGKNYGVDGFVRMEMDFEVMLCDFTSGVEVASFANLVGRRSNQSILSSLAVFEVMNSGSWHNRFPGETRVQLDLAGLISFYDTQLAPSLVAIRAGQERWDHRVQNISSEDLSVAKSRLEDILTRREVLSSGIDWTTLIQVIVDRYAERLDLIRYLLNAPATDWDEILDFANKTQAQLRVILAPYILHSVTPTDPSNKAALDWTTPVYKLCATTHTYAIESELASMTSSEELLLQAVQGTLREICRVVTRMWALGVHAGLDLLLNAKASPDIAEVTDLRNAWAEDLSRLRAWLDWNVWVRCSPPCGLEEMCYLPTWPIGFPPRRRGPRRETRPPIDTDILHSETLTSSEFRTIVLERLAAEEWNNVQPEPDEWIRPQPKCVRRVEPYDF